MTNYDIIIVDHINLLKYNSIDIDLSIILEKRMNDLRINLLTSIYNVDILTINKYIEIYGSQPSLPYHANSNLDKDRQRLKIISRNLKINKILKNDFDV